jgi:prophage maintenance system killer protein
MMKTGKKQAEREKERQEVLDIVCRYAKAWTLLIQYDEDRIPLPAERHPSGKPLRFEPVIQAITLFKNQLLSRAEATELFGQLRGGQLQGILGSIDQTFGGQDLYPSVEEKAAHLLYFVVKDHPFSDGNKRIGALLFLLYLQENSLLDQSALNDAALVTLTLLMAESDPKQKELMTRLVMNLITATADTHG